jgi:ADP-heptose:LPS heptosyltransferase
MPIDKANHSLDFSTIKKVLIIRLGKIGDIVTTSFVFEIIKDSHPNTDIYLLTLKSNQDLLKFNPRLKKVFYSNGNASLFRNLLKLRLINFDLILDFNDNQSTTSSLILRFLSGKYKAAYDFKKYEDIINIKINPLKKDESHIVERVKDFLLQIGISADEKKVKPVFYLNPVILNNIKGHIPEQGKIITINLSAGAKIRYWEKEKWIELIKLIIKKYPTFGLIILSTKEDDKLKEYIHSEISQAYYPDSKTLTIQYFAAYIRISNILITPDTSAVHIASAFGIPTVALYPNYEWNFVSWQPYKIPHRSIRSKMESISQISVDDVFSAFQSLANEIKI